MKEDRDANFIETNNDGVTVNRWPTMAFLSGSSCTNETGWVDLEGGARPRDAADREPSEDLTRTDGVQSGPNIRSRCNDEQLDGHRQRRCRLVMGGNAAEAHPCGFKWVTEAKANHGAKLMVVDPRFTRTAAVADHYAPIRPGTDIALPVGGDQATCSTNDKIHQDYVLNYTNAAYIVKDGYGFEEGLFTGYDAEKRTYDRTSLGIRDRRRTASRCAT